MKHPFSRLGYGVFTICMIFFVLMMLSLSVLFYQNAKMKKISSDRYLQHVNEYYAADQKAIDLIEQLQHLQQESAAIRQLFYEEHDIDVTEEENVVSYTIDINDELLLDVQLYLDENSCTIRQWKVKGR